MRIVFMGTPEFAVASLQRLVENNWNVVAVITAADKPKGRGQKLAFSPVKEKALEFGLPVLQPTNLKSPVFLQELAELRADLQIVVAFRMLPEAVWAMPPKGTFNLHASLLPDYRGAAPINWAIINGETETGVTTFFLKHEIDTGSILFQEKEPIYPEDDAGSLYARLMEKGADLVFKTVDEIANGRAKAIPQDEKGFLHHAPKIFPDTCEIDWSRTAREIHNLIRGLSPHPTARTILGGKLIKLFKTGFSHSQIENTAPGEFSTDGKSFLKVQTGKGVLDVFELQMEGKKRMSIEDFLRGNRLS